MSKKRNQTATAAAPIRPATMPSRSTDRWAGAMAVAILASPLPGGGQAPVVEGLGEVRLDLEGLLVVFDGLGRLALPRERRAPVVEGVGIVRLDLEGLLVVLDGLGRLALPSERIAPVVEGLGVVRVDSGG